MSPEAAVFAADGSIKYRGRINDLYVDLGKKRNAATTHDLRDALDAVLAGSDDVDRFFADLVGREPQLPPHLKGGAT